MALFRASGLSSDETDDNLHADLHMLYGAENGALLPLEPDLVGEHHVAAAADDKLVDASLDWAGDHEVRRRAILTVLNRATRSEHGQIGDRAVQQLRRLIDARGAMLMRDLVAVAIGTPGNLVHILRQVRETMSPTLQDSLQQSVRLERRELSGQKLDASQRRIQLLLLLEESADETALPDFFISYAEADVLLAARIAEILRQSGHKASRRRWDFANAAFMERMAEAFASGARVIAILTPDYLASDYSTAEWQQVLADDPLNRKERLIVLRVAMSKPTGLLAALPFWDLVGVHPDDTVFAEIVCAAIHAEVGQYGGRSLAWHEGRALLHAEIRPSPAFTGREEDLRAIDDALWRGGGSAPVTRPAAVIGLGGIGKSTLAREYALRMQAKYAGIWWLHATRAQNAATWDGIEFGLVELGTIYMPELSQAQDRAAAAERTLDFLAHTGFHKPWLLIYDDVDDAGVLDRWRPRGNVHLLVTTRLAHLPAGTPSIQLSDLSVSEAIEFLRRETGRSDAHEAELASLAETLGRLPIALTLAAAYLRHHPEIPLTAYLAEFERLLSDGSDERARLRSVLATYRKAVDEVERQAPGAVAVLSFAALFDPVGVPAELFEQEAELYPSSVAEFAADRGRLEKCFQALERLSLITFDRNARLISIHPVVQATARDMLDAAKDHWLAAAVAVVGAVYPTDPHNPASRPVCERLTPHAIAVSKDAPDGPVLAQLIMAVGNYLSQRARAEVVLPLYQRAARVFENLIRGDPGNIEWRRSLADSYENIGELFKSQGKLSAALDSYQDSLSFFRDLASTDPENVAWQRDLSVTHNRIGDLRVEQGDLNSAFDAYQNAFAIRQRLAGADPSDAGLQRDLSVSQEKIGDVLKDQGNLPASQPTGVPLPLPNDSPGSIRAIRPGNAISPYRMQGWARCFVLRATCRRLSAAIGFPSQSSNASPGRTPAMLLGSGTFPFSTTRLAMCWSRRAI